LDVDQAIKHLNVKLSSTKGDVSALGFSIKGGAVLSAIPLLILASMLFLLVALRELGSEYEESQYLETPLFYKTNIGVVSKWVTFVAFPVISVMILVVRFFETNSVVSWLGGLFMVGTISCAWLIVKELLSIQQNEPNNKNQPTQKARG